MTKAPPPIQPTPLALGPLPGPHRLTVHLSGEAFSWLQQNFGADAPCPASVAQTWYGSHLLDLALKQDHRSSTRPRTGS